MQLYTVYLYRETALHVSGGTSTHNQERKQLFTASGICHTVTATCRYRGRVGTGLSVLIARVVLAYLYCFRSRIFFTPSPNSEGSVSTITGGNWSFSHGISRFKCTIIIRMMFLQPDSAERSTNWRTISCKIDKKVNVYLSSLMMKVPDLRLDLYMSHTRIVVMRIGYIFERITCISLA
jgi:hypothetical protein